MSDRALSERALCALSFSAGWWLAATNYDLFDGVARTTVSLVVSIGVLAVILREARRQHPPPKTSRGA